MDVSFDYLRKSARAQILNLKPNTTLLFRQCLPHQGMPYNEDNIRIFNYIDFKELNRDENQTMPVRLAKCQMLNIESFKQAAVEAPINTKNTNLKKKRLNQKINLKHKKLRRSERTSRRSERLQEK